MPQMAPLNWLTLSWFFILIFLSSILNFYSFFYSPQSKKMIKTQNDNKFIFFVWPQNKF